ncbi:MAG: hypothetical protein KatS3mg111_4023 [Pirellulaceae bacterium]|nr:MAG: hypothetical protein KatS3mg111_4023 [Pirellulaceae bacterium]
MADMLDGYTKGSNNTAQLLIIVISPDQVGRVHECFVPLS